MMISMCHVLLGLNEPLHVVLPGRVPGILQGLHRVSVFPLSVDTEILPGTQGKAFLCIIVDAFSMTTRPAL